MIGKSWYEYVLIVSSIALLRLIAPASLVYLALSLVWGKFLISPWLGTYMTLEALFLIFVYVPRYFVLQKAATHPPLLDRAQRAALFDRCLKNMASFDFLSAWFLSAKARRLNVKEWFSWAFFSTKLENIQAEWGEEIDAYITHTELTAERSLEPGHDAQVKSMRVTLDPVVMLHRPLLWYMVVACVDTLTYLSFAFSGFRHHTPTGSCFRVFPPRPLTIFSKPSVCPQFPYWHRPHRSREALPILFLHGIGIGLWTYTSFIKDIVARDPDIGIVAIEFLPISMRITLDPPEGRQATCKALEHILDSLGLRRVVVVAHSYGTIVAAHALRSAELAPRIAATLLVDPIPFLLHLPNVAFNFVYRQPRTANEWQLWYFASRDSDVSRALSRHFFWAENILWKEDMEGKELAVSLSGADQVVPTQDVWKYLTGESAPQAHWVRDQLEVLYHPDLDHASIFDARVHWIPLLDVVGRFCSCA